MKTLHLTLKKHWFNQIFRGFKKEEYRAKGDYWRSRFFYLCGRRKQFDSILFKNGYSKDAPWMIVEHKGLSDNDSDLYTIKLGKILSWGNWEAI